MHETIRIVSECIQLMDAGTRFVMATSLFVAAVVQLRKSFH
jgi:hypothetical protein